jgi:hypothetical protein
MVDGGGFLDHDRQHGVPVESLCELARARETVSTEIRRGRIRIHPAVAIRRKSHTAHGVRGGIGVRDVRDQHAVSTDVERTLYEPVIAGGDTDERAQLTSARRSEMVLDRLKTQSSVLALDDDEVEPRQARQFDRHRVAECDEGAKRAGLVVDQLPQPVARRTRHGARTQAVRHVLRPAARTARLATAGAY